MDGVPNSITLAYNEGTYYFGDLYYTISGTRCIGGSASLSTNAAGLGVGVTTRNGKTCFYISPSTVNFPKTLELPKTYTVTAKYATITKTINVTITDWGTPDKTLIENWENEIYNECGWSNPNYSNLTKLTNVCKYIATHYPYTKTDGSYANFCPAYTQKHGGTAGGSCNTSSDTIIYFASKLGLQGSRYYLESMGHYIAQVTIDGKDYYFECGMTGTSPRDWDVTCSDGSGYAAIGCAKSGNAYVESWLTDKERFGRVDEHDIRRLDLYPELNMPSAFGMTSTSSANVLSAQAAPEADEDLVDLTDLILEAEAASESDFSEGASTFEAEEGLGGTQVEEIPDEEENWVDEEALVELQEDEWVDTDEVLIVEDEALAEDPVVLEG